MPAQQKQRKRVQRDASLQICRKTYTAMAGEQLLDVIREGCMPWLGILVFLPPRTCLDRSLLQVCEKPRTDKFVQQLISVKVSKKSNDFGAALLVARVRQFRSIKNQTNRIFASPTTLSSHSHSFALKICWRCCVARNQPHVVFIQILLVGNKWYSVHQHRRRIHFQSPAQLRGQKLNFG
jgi:hypothetical protein